VSEVEFPYRECSKPQKVGSGIYATVSRGEDRGSSLVRYDLLTGAIQTILAAPDPELIGWFVVNDRWLVWSVGNRLFARPRLGGATKLLSEKRDLYAPALNGDLVAWDDLAQDRTHRMVLRDLRANETTVVAPIELADLYNNFPAWDGSRLVWTDASGNAGLYRFYDARTGRSGDYRLEDGRYRFPGYPQPAGRRIYSINFASTDVWDWGAQQVGYYSIAQRRFVPLTPEGSVANSLDVAGGLLAIVDSDQRLTVRNARAPDAGTFRPVAGRVDFVQGSADGTLIAWREAGPGQDRCQLFVITPR
jgi:hypothetical protein